MKSNRFVKSIISLVSAMMLVFGAACSNSNILDTTTAEISSSANDKSEVMVSFSSDIGRGWEIASYEVTATNSNISTPITGSSSTGSVKLMLTAGEWTFTAIGKDAVGNEIYKGRFVTTIGSTNEKITICMVKKSGSMTYNIAAFAADAGTYSSIKVVASKESFSNVIVNVSTFTEKAIFTGLAAGEWTFKTYTVNGSTETLIGTEKYDIVADAIVEKTSEGNPIIVTAAPVISPSGGVYSTKQTVTITCSEDATIYYSTDGKTPTSASLRYTGTFEVSSSITIKAIAVADGKKTSNVTTAAFTISTIPTPSTTSTTVPPITDKIILHAYGYTSLWAWNPKNTSENYTGGSWPGVTMTQENDKWYTHTLNVTSSMVIFSNNGGSQTADLEVAEAGEYWYKDSKWYKTNPDDAVKPTLVSFTASATANASGNVTLTVSATDNAALKSAKITVDNKELGSIELIGTAANGTYTFDTTKVTNGNHTLSCVAYDEAGNASDAKTLEISTSNTFAPKAVINGASSAKVGATKAFNGSASEYLGGTITNYAWTVTGGATLNKSTGESVNITFPLSATTVTVTLTITTSDNKTATASQNVKVTTVSEKTDFREETIYFLMTTRFYDGDTSNNEYCWDEGGEYLPYGDGDCAWRGDFKGLADKLDYIKALGFSAIWITPVVQNSSGIDYHGYHAYDFKTVDPRYESSNFKYQDLIDACHAKGIKVVQDIVLNHTGNFGEKNIFNMFTKDTVPYVNKEKPLPSGAQWNRSPFYSVNPNGYAYSRLMAGLAMTGQSGTYDSVAGAFQYAARINAMKEDNIDTDVIYHHAKMIDWNSENCQLGQMAGDCVDLNTENPTVFEYLKEAYCDYINMGVDAFRIDTVKHISRLTFNKEFIPAFMEAGGDNFYIFGETCARYRGRWNEGVPALSPSFYTWKEDQVFAWSKTDHATNSASATAHFGKYRGDYVHPAWAGGTANHLLKNGRTYHEPDYSKRSHLDQIDFPMHWAFRDAGEAFNTAVNCNDPDFNDATWNVTYVDSHDYAPDNAPENKRFNGYWPDKMNLLWTFRGIPCIYYGSEIEFMKGCGIDPASERIQLNKSGRAYFGDNIEGSVNVTDYAVYSNATAKMAETLNHPLAKHVQRLNLIRRAVRALQKGQYSVEGCSGGISFKRGYKNPGDSEFSFACVAINGGATFTNLPGGTYTEVITGAKKTVSDGGSITSDSIGEGNMRVYVLQSDVTGKIGEAGTYLK